MTTKTNVLKQHTSRSVGFTLNDSVTYLLFQNGRLLFLQLPFLEVKNVHYNHSQFTEVRYLSIS